MWAEGTVLEQPKAAFPPTLLMHLQAPGCNSPGAHGYRCGYERKQLTFSCFLSHAQSCAGQGESEED